MVKPQLNLEKKDNVKAPDGGFVKVVTTTEPLPLKQDSTPVSARRGCRAGKVLCSLLCTLLVIVVMFMMIKCFFFVSMKPAGYYTCGVGYFEGDAYGQDYMYYYEGSLGSETPYGNDMLMAPRPTGAPLLRYLEEGVEINLELRIIRINTPANSDGPGGSVVHDFEMNFSAYQVPSSDVCYIRPLNFDSTLCPEEFQSLLENEAYRNQEFQASQEVFMVDSSRDASDIGSRLEELCGDYAPYYIQAISPDQEQQFWMTARQMVRDHLPQTRFRDGSRSSSRSSSSSSSEEGERRRPGSRHHGSRHGSDEDRVAQRHVLRNFVDSLRSFDGQQVVNIHVFQAHSLQGVSDESLARLMAFQEGAGLP